MEKGLRVGFQSYGAVFANPKTPCHAVGHTVTVQSAKIVEDSFCPGKFDSGGVSVQGNLIREGNCPNFV